MALTVKALVLVVVVMSTALFGVTLGGTVHTIGGSAGWTTMGNIDYAKWASSQKFMVGDTLVFNYNKQYHNVLQVTLQEYHSCNVTSAPIAAYASGSDSITIKTTGHFYYLCGVPGHCQKGQKVDIRVTRTSTSPSPAPAPLAGTPTPVAQSDAPVLRSVKLWLVLGFLAALLCFGN